MNRITRDRLLTDEEAGKYDRIREQIDKELPELVARHQQRMAAKEIGKDKSATPAVTIPGVSVTLAPNPRAGQSDELGMRPMQAKVWQHRGEQYLLIKSPPASGKSRALMFVALHKLKEKDVKQVIVTVPENSIGSSFNDEPLSTYGFFADWHVEPKWNLSNAPGGVNGSKVDAVGRFLASNDPVLVCAHATFRFAVEKYGVEAFDNRLIAIDEFHHVAVGDENKLGEYVRSFIARDKVHIVAMTGSYFRGDAIAVLDAIDEEKFKSVTFTYYEQLNGYKYLKTLDIGYYLYSGAYIEKRDEKASIFDVLNPNEKTIVHIPNVNSRESTGDKLDELNKIMSGLGVWQGPDPETGFDLVKTPEGRVLRIADLVDDAPDRAVKRGKVLESLKDPAQKNNRDHVDMIIALGMAKEGFDWIWCEHALTVGYRSSLTEVVQIIGRATRDAPGKTRARFTNLIAEPDASEEAVTEAVNDTLKAIAASLLMEQVLAPRIEFKLKSSGNEPTPGLDYGPGGYRPGETNVGVDPITGGIQMEIKGLVEPKSAEAQRIVKEDLLELVTTFVQDTKTVQDGLFNQDAVPPQEITQLRMGKIVKEKYPALSEEDQEAVRQQAVAAMTLVQKGDQLLINSVPTGDDEPSKNTALIDGIRKFCTDVRELSIDMIDAINPFGQAYAILAKSLGEARLRAIEEVIQARKTTILPEEALDLAKRAHRFKAERGRVPSLTSPDAWEKRMAEGATAFMRYKAEGRYHQRVDMDDIDLDELAEGLSEFAAPQKALGRSALEQRIIAGFEEIERFVEEHGRVPEHGDGRDIFERLYAVRLGRLRALPECRAVLKDVDKRGLLGPEPGSAAPSDEEPNLDELSESLSELAGPADDVTRLVHVRDNEERKAAEEVAQRQRCEDFETFRPIFEQVQKDLNVKIRMTVPFVHEGGFKVGDMFILDGQKVYVADVGEVIIKDFGREDSRLRVIFDNGTESNMLLRSLQRALYHAHSRRILPRDSEAAPLFSDQSSDDDQQSGTIYVLESKSDHAFVAEHRSSIHKIGVTGGDVRARIGNARKDPTYLLADVDIVATYQLANLNRKRLEAMLHRVFASARLDVALKDRFGAQAEPREWYLVPLPAIDEAIEKIRDGSIGEFRYDPKTARLIHA